MKRPIQFHHILRAVIERADVQHRQATGKPLSLYTIARAIGIDITTLAQALCGERPLETSYLLPLLVYLGCDEKEQRFIFHFAEITQREGSATNAGHSPNTDELSALLFNWRNDTDPTTERITEKRPSL